MRFLLVLFSLLVTLNGASASTIPVSPMPPIGSVSGGWATIGATTINGGAAAIEMEARMAGVVAKFPATARLAGNAASVGLLAVRLNPVGLATSAVLQYLLQAGIQRCLEPGGWCVPANIPSAADPGFNGYVWTMSGFSGDSPAAACSAYAATQGGQNTLTYNSLRSNGDGSFLCLVNVHPPSGSDYIGGLGNVYSTSSCVAGYVLSGGTCIRDPKASTVAANDSDWNKALSYPMPDQVATDLSAAKVPLPVTIAPTLTPITVNLGDPYVDPVTGQRYRDVAVITPNADGKTATLNVVKQPVDANGNPATDPTTGTVKPPEKQDDPCTGHETRLGCTEQGQIPDAPDLKENTVNVAITPDGGWGADNASCPADIPFTAMGRTFAISWSPVCSFASMIRPLIIALAWLASAFIVVGAKQGGGD